MKTIRVAPNVDAPEPIRIVTPEWFDRAACAGIGAEADVEDAKSARRFVRRNCSWCPVKAECLEYGLKIKATGCVYGGLVFNVHGVPNERWVADPADPRFA